MRRTAGLIAAVVVLGACSGGSAPATVRTQSFAPAVVDVAAMVALPGGGVRVGVRSTGVIEDVSPSGTVGPMIAQLDVRSDGQRGLLGLTVDARGRTFASWTRPDGRLVVGQVAPGPTRIVWEGPTSAELANGGHLAPVGGRLLIGIGDLTQNERKDDPAAINGKLVTLDPDGAPDQKPQPLSAGWNNPFAFTVLDDGAVWVADNSPGDSGERLTRGDTTVADPTELPAGTAPSGIDHIGTDRLVVCGYKSGALLEYGIGDGRAQQQRTLARDCRTAIVVLTDRRVLYETDDGLHVVNP